VLTSDATSPIAQLSDYVIDLGMGIEQVGFVTKGYVATVLQLMLLGMTIGASKDKLTEAEVNDYQMQLQHLVAHIPTVIENSQLFFEKNEAIFRLTTRFIGIGYGSNWGTVKEFETKFTETIRKPSSGFELEAYMHGPYLGLHNEDIVIFIEPNGKLAERSGLLKKFLNQHIQHVYTIYANHNQSLLEHDLELDLEIDELLASLFMTIPVHLLAYRLSQEKGIDLQHSAYPDFDKITSSKI
jgi:glucoselysine-6-phosphate deglycase